MKRLGYFSTNLDGWILRHATRASQRQKAATSQTSLNTSCAAPEGRAMGETSDADRIAWLLARWEELYDVLELTGPVRHPVDATEQVRIQRDDLTVAERRARRWEAFGRRIWRERGAICSAWRRRVDEVEQAWRIIADALRIERDQVQRNMEFMREELDTARRELGDVRRLVEEHRQSAKAANFKAWTAYNDGREDALNELSDALAALGKEQGNG